MNNIQLGDLVEFMLDMSGIQVSGRGRITNITQKLTEEGVTAAKPTYTVSVRGANSTYFSFETENVRPVQNGGSIT